MYDDNIVGKCIAQGTKTSRTVDNIIRSYFNMSNFFITVKAADFLELRFSLYNLHGKDTDRKTTITKCLGMLC